MTVEIAFVMDKSGSMETLAGDAIGGFNRFLKDQKNVDGAANFTLVLFDTNYVTPYISVDIRLVPGLDDRSYKPGGGTALLDAMGFTITNLKSRIALGSFIRPKKVIVGVMTDGQENSSKQYKRAQIREMVQECQKYGWEFIYLGANQDAFAEAGGMGIPQWATATMDSGPVGLRAAFNTASTYTSSLRGGATGQSIGAEGGVAGIYGSELAKEKTNKA